jgi:hypothetical protein
MNFATRTTTNMAHATCAELTLEKNTPSLPRRAGLGVPSGSVESIVLADFVAGPAVDLLAAGSTSLCPMRTDQ